MSKNKLTQEYLKECLTYNPDTGIFTWNTRPSSHFKSNLYFKSWNARYAETESGTPEPKAGYRQISINNKRYRSHRLAFLYMEGYFPENQVDHIDRDRTNNKWDNLREVSIRCNSQNCNIAKDNTSGVCGISWHKIVRKWEVYITTVGKKYPLGYFDNLDDAVMARYQEEITNPLWTCSVESTAYKYLKERNLI